METPTIPTHPLFEDLRDKTFGRLTVRSYAGSRQTPGGRTLHRWLCDCACGKQKVVGHQPIKNGDAASCGCIKHEMLEQRNTKHGKCGTPEYNTWANMLQRCTNDKLREYGDYGGRGITVCDRWTGANGFENFLQDMGPRPFSRASIDRVDTNGNYTPENCRWANDFTQAGNRRNNLYFTYRGERKCLSSWCRELNLNYEMTYSRVKRGWTFEQAITLPYKARLKSA